MVGSLSKSGEWWDQLSAGNGGLARDWWDQLSAGRGEWWDQLSKRGEWWDQLSASKYEKMYHLKAPPGDVCAVELQRSQARAPCAIVATVSLAIEIVVHVSCEPELAYLELRMYSSICREARGLEGSQRVRALFTFQ